MNKYFLTCFFSLIVVFRVFSQDTSGILNKPFQNQKPDTLVSYSDQVTDLEISERLQMIHKMLDKNERGAENWWNEWLVIYSVATVGQTAVACYTGNKSTREDMALGASTTLVGALGQFLSPVKSGYKVEQFQQYQNLPIESRKEALKQAETYLKMQAELVRVGNNWQKHAICGIVNLSSGLITWIGFKRSVWDGIANFALNTIVTEVQIWSQPGKAKRDYQKYCNLYGLSNFKPSIMPELELYAHVLPGGIGLDISF